MKKLFTFLFFALISLTLMGQQANQDLKDLKDFEDLKEQRYTKKHRSGHTTLESKRPGNSENRSRHNFRQLRYKQGTVLKAGNATEQKMDSLLWEVYDAGSSSWVLSDRELFTYDSEGNMTTFVWFAYDSVEMKILPFDKETVKYDDEGNPTEIIWQIWDNESSQWVNWGKYLLSYDGDGNLIQETISDWDPDGNQWLEGARFDLTYDDSGNLLMEIWSFWDEDELKIVQAYREEYLYEDGNLTTLNEYGWEEGDWVLFFRTLYEYDTSDNLKFAISGKKTMELTQAWNSDDGTWIDYFQIFFTYDDNGMLILKEVWEFSWFHFVLELARQYISTYDTDGNLIEQFIKFWEAISTKGTNSWQNASKSEWTYNKDFNIADLFLPYWFFMDDSNITFVNMPVSETGYIYEGENWVMDSRQSAYFSDFGSSTGIEDREETSLKIFPIPASETLTINWDDSFSTLRFELYDLTGKRVILRAIDNNETIGVNHLSGGMYLYKLSSNDHLIYSGKVSIR